jgi:hypothetical protein
MTFAVGKCKLAFSIYINKTKYYSIISVKSKRKQHVAVIFCSSRSQESAQFDTGPFAED